MPTRKGRLVIPTLLCMCAVCHAQPVTRPATIGVFGHYSATINGWLGEMGLDYEPIAREPFGVADLGAYELVVLTRPMGQYALGAQQRAALADYVGGGGRLIAAGTNIPPGGKFPSLAGTGYGEGWGANITLASPNCPLAGALKPGEVLSYGVWASGFVDLEPSEVDVWAQYTERGSSRPDYELARVAREGRIAIFAGSYGEGRYVWCGPHLGYTADGPWYRVFQTMVEYLLPDAGRSAFVEALEAQVPLRQDAEKIAGEAIAILDEPAMPRPAMPRQVTAELIEDILRDDGRQVARLSVEDAIQDGLSADAYAAVIWMLGESAPIELLRPVKQFLAGGGGLVLPAGRPFAKLLYRTEGQWEDYGSGPRFQALFQHLLPFTKYYTATLPPKYCVNLCPELLGRLPDLWELAGGATTLYPYVRTGFSTRTVQKLAASITEGGEVCGVPLWINDADPHFPCARILSMGFAGDSHPWNPGAWDWSRQAVLDMTDLVCRKRQVVVKDVWTERACYRAPEPVRVHTQLQANFPGSVELQVVLAERDSGKEVFRESRPVQVQPGSTQEAVLTWPDPSFGTWAYDVVVTVDEAEGPHAADSTLFTVWRPDILDQCPEFKIDGGILLRDGRPQWLAGTNLYLNDSRAITAFWGAHPLPDFLDRDLSYQDLVGANATRQHYMQKKVTVADLGSGQYTAGLSTADAYCMLGAAHEQWTKFGVNVHLLGSGGGGTGRFPGPDRWDEQEQWLRTMARRYRQAPHVHWEIINEPHEQDAVIPDWVTRMKDAVVQETGKLPSCAIGWWGLKGVWSPQAAPRGLPMNDLHFYSPDGDRAGDGLSVPYGMSLAWPALLGELGMPNAQTSAETRLGDWGPIYDRMLHYLIGEQGIGFLNFYLANLTSTTGNEWGLLHHDMVEKENAHAFKRWLTVLRHLDKTGYLPPDVLLAYSTEQYLADRTAVSRKLRSSYVALFNKGLRPRVIDQRDVVDWPATPAAICVPGWVELAPATVAALGRLAGDGCRLVRLGEEPDGADGLPFVALDALVPPETGVQVDSGLARITYVLRKQDGGRTVLLIDGSGKQGAVRFAGHEVRTAVRQGRSATLDFASDGKLRLVEGWGDLTVDGRPAISGGSDGYVVAPLGAGGLFDGGPVEIDATNQSALSIAPAPSNSVGGLRQVTICAPTGAAYDESVEGCRARMEELAVSVSVRRGPVPIKARGGNLLVIGNPLQNPLAAEAQDKGADLPGRWDGSGLRPCLRFGRARVWHPWSGMILVGRNPWSLEGRLILVAGLSPAGTQVACRKLISLTVLDSYAVAPTVRLRRDL